MVVAGISHFGEELLPVLDMHVGQPSQVPGQHAFLLGVVAPGVVDHEGVLAADALDLAQALLALLQGKVVQGVDAEDQVE